MLDNFKNRMKRIGENQGSAYLYNADMVIDKTFKRDPAYREVIVTHIPSDIDHQKYDAKFSIHTRRSITGDSEDYYLTFRPHVKVPIGSYVDIPDDEGILQTWLIVLKDDKPQFPMYYVLKCNWTLKWIVGDKAYKVLGCLRNQNSYNSGLWTDNIFETVENQNKFWMPTTPYTQTVEYGQRFVINDSGRAIPIVWKCSKVEDVQPVGLTKLTFAQEVANLHEDCSKYGIAGWCPCTDHMTEKPEVCKLCTIEEPAYIDAGLEIPGAFYPAGKITYVGKNTNLRVGGKHKTFTSEFWNSINQGFASEEAIWKMDFRDADETICAVKLHYNINNGWQIALSESSPIGTTINVEKNEKDECNVSCTTEAGEILQFYVSPSAKNWHAINIRLPQLYSMVGKKIILSSHNIRDNHTEEVVVEVIS